ncbi:MAG: PAS domain S-box protein, partial [Rhodospirillales bacterium]|nr:PAS domain S-box protein [Rhodospirillales bacterium]
MKNLSLKSAALAFIILLVTTGALIVVAGYVTLHNVRDIETKWSIFQAGRSEKVRAVNALRRELGYGGMIHNFKNFILRRDVSLEHAVDTKLGGAQAIITQYRSLGADPTEEKALADIENVLSAYGAALVRAGTMIAAGVTTGIIDQAVRVDDSPALEGLKTLDIELSRQREITTSARGKSQFVSDLRRAIGYGGMIHNFENFVLRHDQGLKSSVEFELGSAMRALDGYENLGVSAEERRALENIRATLAAYGTALTKADEMAQANASLTAIYAEARVPDGSALAGIETLEREIIAANNRDAERVTQSLGLVADVAVTAVWILTALILILIAASLILIRGRVVGALTHMTDLMTRLAEGDLNIPISRSNQTNEIGAMENALVFFRDTAIERINAEAARLEQEKRYRLIMDTAADGIITASDRGIIELVNPATESMFGYTADELIGQSIDILLPDTAPGNHVQFIDQYNKSGIARVIGLKNEFDARHKDGREFAIELSVTKLELGARTLFPGIIRDIRERKLAEVVKDQFVST